MSFLIHVQQGRTTGYISCRRPTREEVAHTVREVLTRVAAADLRARLDDIAHTRAYRACTPFIDAISHTTHIEREYPTYIDMLTQDACMWDGGDTEPTSDHSVVIAPTVKVDGTPVGPRVRLRMARVALSQASLNALRDLTPDYIDAPTPDNVTVLVPLKGKVGQPLTMGELALQSLTYREAA